MENDRHVNEYLQNNEYRTKIYKYANINRLDPNNEITKPITLNDIKIIIKEFKNKAPGISGINQLVLSNLPDWF